MFLNSKSIIFVLISMLHVSCASILKPAYLEMNSTLFAVWKPTENDGASFDHIVEMWSFLKENRVKNAYLLPKNEYVVSQRFELIFDESLLWFITPSSSDRFLVSSSLSPRLMSWIGDQKTIEAKIIYRKNASNVGKEYNEVMAIALDGGPFFKSDQPN